LENATLETKAGFRAFYNVDMIGNRLGSQIWQELRRLLLEILVPGLFGQRASSVGNYNFRAAFK